MDLGSSASASWDLSPKGTDPVRRVEGRFGINASRCKEHRPIPKCNIAMLRTGTCRPRRGLLRLNARLRISVEVCAHSVEFSFPLFQSFICFCALPLDSFGHDTNPSYPGVGGPPGTWVVHAGVQQRYMGEARLLTISMPIVYGQVPRNLSSSSAFGVIRTPVHAGAQYPIPRGFPIECSDKTKEKELNKLGLFSDGSKQRIAVNLLLDEWSVPEGSNFLVIWWVKGGVKSNYWPSGRLSLSLSLTGVQLLEGSCLAQWSAISSAISHQTETPTLGKQLGPQIKRVISLSYTIAIQFSQTAWRNCRCWFTGLPWNTGACSCRSPSRMGTSSSKNL